MSLIIKDKLYSSVNDVNKSNNMSTVSFLQHCVFLEEIFNFIIIPI